MYNWAVKKYETAVAISEAIRSGACTTQEQVSAIAAKYEDDLFWIGNIFLGSNESKDIDTIIYNILREFGIPANLSGYKYLKQAIKVATQNAYLSTRTMEICSAVAEQFGTTTNRVERTIRHAIEAAFDKCNFYVAQKYFSNTISIEKRKPTNSEFISTIAEYVSMQMKK